jgi:hypothetical protein
VYYTDTHIQTHKVQDNVFSHIQIKSNVMAGENTVLATRFWQHEVMLRGFWSIGAELHLGRSNEF